ncbi:MAG: PIN domain-containing protein [Nitrospirota bacterium]|nr:PIN domain-containing protein [Nitrospirota bacterium]
MIKDGVIVDTSVLIDFLKNTEPNAKAVESLIAAKRVFTTGIIMAELLQGIKSAKEEGYVTELLDGIPAIEVNSATWVHAARLACSLRRKGLTLPLTDVAIATVAIEHKFSVFTLDKHFEQIPGVVIYNAS